MSICQTTGMFSHCSDSRCKDLKEMERLYTSITGSMILLLTQPLRFSSTVFVRLMKVVLLVLLTNRKRAQIFNAIKLPSRVSSQFLPFLRDLKLFVFNLTMKMHFWVVTSLTEQDIKLACWNGSEAGIKRRRINYYYYMYNNPWNDCLDVFELYIECFWTFYTTVLMYVYKTPFGGIPAIYTLRLDCRSVE